MTIDPFDGASIGDINDLVRARMAQLEECKTILHTALRKVEEKLRAPLGVKEARPVASRRTSGRRPRASTENAPASLVGNGSNGPS